MTRRRATPALVLLLVAVTMISMTLIAMMTMLLLMMMAANSVGRDEPREISVHCKTAAAEVRQRLTETGLLHATRTGLQIADRKALEEDLLGGYERVLRPELLLC